MKRHEVVVWAILGLGVIAGFRQAAAEETFPDSLIGFLKSDTIVSVRLGDPMVAIRVFTPEQHQMAMDVRTMERDAVVKKYPQFEDVIAEATAREEARFEARLKARGGPQRDGQSLKTHLIYEPSAIFYRLVHVGADYILAERISERKERVVLRNETIKQITWASDQVVCNTSWEPVRQQ